MIFDKFHAALGFGGLSDLEQIHVYVIQFFVVLAKKCFSAKKKSLEIFINLSEFSAVAIDILTQI